VVEDGFGRADRTAGATIDAQLGIDDVEFVAKTADGLHRAVVGAGGTADAGRDDLVCQDGRLSRVSVGPFRTLPSAPIGSKKTPLCERLRQGRAGLGLGQAAAGMTREIRRFTSIGPLSTSMPRISSPSRM